MRTYRLASAALVLGGLVVTSTTASAPSAVPAASGSTLDAAVVGTSPPSQPSTVDGAVAVTGTAAGLDALSRASTGPGAAAAQRPAAQAVPVNASPDRTLASQLIAPRRPPMRVRELNELRSDFNGDGRSDLAVAELRRLPGGQFGAVDVLFGAPQGGFTNAGSQYFDYTAPGMPNDDGSPDPHDESNDFGVALASGDFNNDGYDDLAVGSVHDRFRVLYGSPSGLTTTGARMIRFGEVAPAADLPGEGVDGENQFGIAFTVGDFDGDGIDDLVTGAPRAGGRPWVGGGGVALLRGTPDGLSPAAAQWIPGNAPGLPIAVNTDGFGQELAAADFNNDGRDDLAVGFDRNRVGAADFAGSVVIFPGATSGLSVVTARAFTQDTPGMPDVAEGGDSFGHVLAAGDITGDGYADLVVNADEGFVSGDVMNRGGSLTVLRGSSSGLTVAGAQYWTQQTPGVPGSDDPAASFGSTLAFGDFDHDGRGDVVVGSPQETVGGVTSSGAITIFRGSPQGLTVTGIRRLDWTTPGMPAIVRTAPRLGDDLHTVRQPNGAAILVAGAKYATVSGLQAAGAVIVLPGTTRFQRAAAVALGPGGLTVGEIKTWSAADLPEGPQEFAWFGMTLA